MGGTCAVLLDWWMGGEMGGTGCQDFPSRPTATGTRALFTYMAACGDMTSKAPGVGKCYTEHGGNVVGTPTCGDRVDSYAWVYRWKATSTSN